jgi:hypothetical protein
MRIRRTLCVLFASCTTASLACEVPTVVEIPEAKDIKGQGNAIFARTEDYVRDMVEYVGCIKAEIDAAGGENAPPLLIGLLVARNNAAVAEVKAVMELYEERVGPLDDAAVANAMRGADDILRSGAALPIQSRAPSLPQ